MVLPWARGSCPAPCRTEALRSSTSKVSSGFAGLNYCKGAPESAWLVGPGAVLPARPIQGSGTLKLQQSTGTLSLKQTPRYVTSPTMKGKGQQSHVTCLRGVLIPQLHLTVPSSCLLLGSVRVTHLFPLVTENTPAATTHTALQLPQHLLPDKHFFPLLNYFITQSTRYAAPAQGFVAKPALAKPEGLSLNPCVFINAMPRS